MNKLDDLQKLCGSGGNRCDIFMTHANTHTHTHTPPQEPSPILLLTLLTLPAVSPVRTLLLSETQ